MDRYRQALLVIAIGLTGCAQELPKRFYLDTEFDEHEVSAIRDAVDAWNRVCLTRLPEPTPCLIEIGRLQDRFNPNDLNDDRHVVYKLERQEWGNGPPFDSDTSGYGTVTDVLLRTHMYWEIDGNDPDDDGSRSREAYWFWLRKLALHELGHFLGLMHFNHRPAVMNKTDNGGINETLTEADIDQFCLVYGCR